MEEYAVKIISIEDVTHDVKRFIVEKPPGYSFIPGQATEVAINLPGFVNERRPFTFTSLNAWEYLEFTIKIYNDHEGVTKKLNSLHPGNELLIHEVWGSIHYNEPGIFIAGGAGITPFIAILRDLNLKNQLLGNRLIFANKTKADIILEKEFNQMHGLKFINILSHEKVAGYSYGFINEHFLAEEGSNSRTFYLCGPPPMMESIERQLNNLYGNSISIIKEEF